MIFGNSDKYIWWNGTNLEINGVTISNATLQSATGVATEDYVDDAITALLGGAPGALDTLNELAAALNDDADFHTAVTTSLGNKVGTASSQALANTGNALTISGSTITLARANGTTDVVAVPNTNTQRTDEEIRDLAAGIITAGTNISVVKNDTANTVTIASTDTNTTYTAGTGMTLTGTQFINAAPDQTVGLTGGGLTTISGSYPNFTISSSADGGDADELGGVAASNYVTNVHGQALHASDALSVSGTTVTLRRADGNTETITTQDTNTFRAISSTPANGATTTSISSGWAYANVKTAVPVNALFTDTNTNTTYTASSGITLTGTNFTNSAPDRTVSLTGGGATTISGTYPDFTISSTDNNTNTVTSVGISGSQTTGTITIQASGASSVSQSGSTITISSTDTNTNTDTWRPIHDSPSNGATTTSISSNWAFDNVKTAVPSGAVFTDTVNSSGVTTINETGSALTVANGTSATVTLSAHANLEAIATGVTSGNMSVDFLEADVIVANHITANTIDAGMLTVGNSSSASTSRLLLLEDSLKIFSGSALRVHIGNLANTDNGT